jgi:hypothetical protein
MRQNLDLLAIIWLCDGDMMAMLILRKYHAKMLQNEDNIKKIC